jgi:glycosyltransferase involved in cell wall biosynthesis
MNILIGNKYHKSFGGAETYYFSLIDMLTETGHSLAHFSMKDIKNVESKWSNYFVDNVDFHRHDLKQVPRLIYRLFNREHANHKINKLLDVFSPQVAHFQNIYYHIPPSILAQIHFRNIPIIYTVHDFHPISYNVNLTTSKVSLSNVLSYLAWRYHNHLSVYAKHVDLFIVPSNYMRRMLIEHGYPRSKIIYMPNFLPDNPIPLPKKRLGNYVLYFGRLYDHKGINLILESVSRLPNIPFKVVGDGPLRNKVENCSLYCPNLSYIPWQNAKQLTGLIDGSSFCLMPSLWPENQPLTIGEAYMRKKTVIASRIGGIPEIVVNNKTGILVNPNDSEALTRAIKRLWEKPLLWKNLGEAGYVFAAQKFDKQAYYRQLMRIYEQVSA